MEYKLNLIGKRFKLIFSGEKQTEYRDIKPYYCSMFLLVEGEHKTRTWWENKHNKFPLRNGWTFTEYIKQGIETKAFTYKLPNSVWFYNGYTKERPTMKCNLTNIIVGKGRKNWGAAGDTEYPCLNLNGVKEHNDLRNGEKR